MVKLLRLLALVLSVALLLAVPAAGSTIGEPRGFVLLSAGRDGQIGTADDIYVTEKGEVANGAVDLAALGLEQKDLVPSSKPTGSKEALLLWEHKASAAADFGLGELSGLKAAGGGGLELADNYVLAFNGGRIRVEGLAGYNFGNRFTVELWLKHKGGDYRGVINNGYWDGSGFELRFGREYSGTRMHYRINTGNGHSLANMFPSPNVWHHVAVSYDGAAVRYYLDGNLVGTASLSGNIVRVPSPVWMGWNGSWGEYYYGLLDEAIIWTRPRTQEEIREDMIRGPVGDEAGLTAWWRFDEGQGNVVRDSSRNRFHGLIEGSVSWVRDRGTYVARGMFVSPAVDVPAGVVAESMVSWDAETPEGTEAALEVSVSLDGGATWSGWMPARNGGDIPGLPLGIRLEAAKIRYRVSLSTADRNMTPVLRDVFLTTAIKQ